ncbi:hypothetical protein D3C85_1812680 [compost metagenome]
MDMYSPLAARIADSKISSPWEYIFFDFIIGLIIWSYFFEYESIISVVLSVDASSCSIISNGKSVF